MRRDEPDHQANLFVRLGAVTFLLPATVFGFLGIGPAVVFREGATLVVVFNTLRLLGYKDGADRSGGSDGEVGS